MMAIEIGNLVVKGTFGRPQSPDKHARPEEIEARLRQMRLEILSEVREILAEADRRARER